MFSHLETGFLKELSLENRLVYLHLREALVRVGLEERLHVQPVKVLGLEWNPDYSQDEPRPFLDYRLVTFFHHERVYAYFTWDYTPESKPLTTVNVIVQRPWPRILDREIGRAIEGMNRVLPRHLFTRAFLGYAKPPLRRTSLNGEFVDYAMY